MAIALVVTPEGFPLAYEAMPGSTSKQATLAPFLEKIKRQYGRSERIWIMDRGIPSEETLASRREGGAPLRYLVGTPRGRLTRLETAFPDFPWQELRQSVSVKLLVKDGELDVLVRPQGRLLKDADLARCQYDAADATTRLLVVELARRWNGRLVAVRQREERLAGFLAAGKKLANK